MSGHSLPLRVTKALDKVQQALGDTTGIHVFVEEYAPNQVRVTTAIPSGTSLGRLAAAMRNIMEFTAKATGDCSCPDCQNIRVAHAHVAGLLSGGKPSCH